MPEYDDEGNEIQPQQTQLSVEDLKALRQAKKERDELSSKYEAQNRELAFAKAKIDMDDPRTKYFIKGYDGELTPEAIRAQAEADGFFQKAQTNTGELTAQQRIANASAGGGTSGPDLADQIKQAQSQEEVMAIMIAAGYPTSWSSQ